MQDLFAKGILPKTASISGDGHLVIGGCDTVELAREHGTALFVMDEAHIRSQCREYVAQTTLHWKDVEVIYASKAFVSLAMCQLIKQEGLALDVSSGGELYLALKAGFDPTRIYMHGNNKTPDELALALDSGVGRIVVDSFDELELLSRMAVERSVTQPVLLRITPGIKPSTHTYIQTGQIDSKFGFGLVDGRAMTAVKQALDTAGIELAGIHVHIGSQIFALHSYAKAIELVVEFMSEIRAETGFELAELNTGGGLGVPYGIPDEPSTVQAFGKVIVDGIKDEVTKHGMKVPKIMVEPGRSIVANAGVTLYTVGTIKEIPGIRTYISVDGGMSENLRPMLYGAVYEALLANRADEVRDTAVTVAGKHCESGDILIRDALLPAPKVGDILCTPATGAYGYVMANNYNKQPRPAVVLASDGDARVIVRRETYEDLMNLELPLE